MKKILSVLIAAAMLLSTLAVCVLPAVAADDDYSASNDQFIISTAREDLFMDDDDRGSRPGGVYTQDGFSVNPLDPEYSDYKVTWPNNAPYVSTQTLADLAYQGFFMEVRIDDFSYWEKTVDEYGNEKYSYVDRWYAFTIWDSVGVMPAQLGTDSDGKDWGNGLEFLIRVNPGSDYTKNPDPESITYLSHIEWYDDTESVREKERYRPADNTPSIPAGTEYENTVIGSDGALYLTFEIKYDSANDRWTPYVNGVKAPVPATGKDVISESLTAMLYGDCEHVDEEGLLNQYEAYIGFTMQSAQKDAACSYTITKIGRSSTDYDVPNGDENIEARQRDNAVDPIDPRDPDSDPAEPAFVITGDPDSFKNVRSVAGAAKLQLTEDGTVQITSNNGSADPMFRPYNNQSYDMRDYPCVAMIVKNFCTCVWIDTNHDNIPDPYCNHTESVETNFVAGNYPYGYSNITGRKINTGLNEEFVDADGNTYSIYIFNFTELMENEGLFDEPQRIHGMYPQFNSIKMDLAGRNVFELVAYAHLATEDGAVEWANTYLAENISSATPDTPEVDDPDTDAPEVDDPDTDAPDTDAPDTNAPETETETEAGPEIPDADSELTVKDAADLGLALGNGKYTDGCYFVSGTVAEVLDSETGKMTIVDEDGNTILINGLYSDGGDLAYNELMETPIAGDWVYVYGAVGCNEDTPEIKDAWLMDYVLEERPVETDPVETDPVETDPVETDPVETDPVETDPVETDPVETDPVETDPVETDPIETDPIETDPIETDPMDTDPIETDPIDTDPVETDPVETDPVETDPIDTEPKPTETETEPTETESKPAQTEPKQEQTEDETDAPAKEGCRSVAGFGAMAIVAVAAVGLVSFKKKED